MFFKDVETTCENIKKELNDNSDIATRYFNIANKKVGVIFFKSMVSNQLIIDGIMSPMMDYQGKSVDNQKLINEILKSQEVSELYNENEIIINILKNNVVILLEGEETALGLDFESFPTRPPTEPPTSPVIYGPREGFTENIKTNISLIRRRIKSSSLKLEDIYIGKYTNTRVTLTYLTEVADKSIVKKIKERISQIDIDGIIDSSYILTFLQERPNSIFKQVGQSEKPDVICSKILEGRVAILVDGSPIVLTLPFIFLEDLQNSNDYYTNNHYATFVRIIRVLGIIVASIVPGLYLSLRLYHYNIMPINYLITISDATQGLPFTPFVEVLFILILFRILYEVSLRLPSYLGLATSIVGALILGDTGVKAGLISPPGVVVVAMSVISIYVVPDEAAQMSILRAIFLILGGTLGLLGIVSGVIIMINYLNGLNGYGAPYLAPFSPRILSDTKDAILKVPITQMKLRPKSIKNKNKTRLK